MKIRWLWMLALMWVLIGCSLSTRTKGPAVSTAFRLSITPNDALGRFDVLLESEDAHPLCLTIEQWPNPLGQLGGWKGQAKVVLADAELSSKLNNFGYCPINCTGLTITRKQPLHGFIAYDQFASPEPLATVADKRLVFDVQPSVCHKAFLF